MPKPAAPMASDSMTTRLRSRAWSCITGSNPASMQILLEAILFIRAEADALSVKLAATT